MENGNMTKRFISMLLAVVMVFSMLPAGPYASAEGIPEEQEETAELAPERDALPESAADENEKDVGEVEQTMWPVEYVLNGGENSPENPDAVSPDESYVLNNAEKPGFLFEGWYSDAAFSHLVTSIDAGTDAGIKLYAKFTARTFTVSFNSEGGSSAAPVSVTFEAAYGELPAVEKENCDFAGWQDENGNPVTEQTVVSNPSDHTLHAVWTARPEVQPEQPKTAARPPLKVPATPSMPEGLYIIRNGQTVSLNTGSGAPAAISYGDTVTVVAVWPANWSNASNVLLYVKTGSGDYGELTPLNNDGTLSFRFPLSAAPEPYEFMFTMDGDETNAQGDVGSGTYYSDGIKAYLKIDPVAIGVPEISWNGTTASWTSSSTVNGLSVTPASYSYTVFREGTAVKTGSGSSVDISQLIAANGSGKYSVSVKAVASADSDYADSAESEASWYADSSAPVISAFSAGDAVGMLKAVVSDDISGIRTYAFSKSASADGVSDGEKVTADLSKVPGTPITFTFDATSSGTWYFHAWDCFGNPARSTSGISVYEVSYRNYYVSDVLTEKADFLVDGQSKTITLSAPERTGYVFTGWYTDSGCTVPLTNNTVDCTMSAVYAGWKQISLDISVTPSAAGNSYSKTYDGQPLTLTAETDARGAEVTWSWTDKSSGAVVSSSAQFAPNGVSQSGTYTVTASAEVFNGFENVPVSNSAEVVVQILPQTVTVTLQSQEITYGDAAPAYTYALTGLVAGETEVTAAGFSVTPLCDYAIPAKADAGEYPITAEAHAENYVFSIKKGTLRVLPKNVSKTCEVSLSQEEYTYDGTDQTPEITVVCGGLTLLPGTDYTLSWPEDVRHVGEKTVTVNFTGNYAGSVSETYEIRRAGLDEAYVELSSWVYDGTAKTPELKRTGSNPEDPSAPFPSASNVTFIYATATIDDENPANSVKGSALSSAPVNAGEYCVWAVIAPENDNYVETVTAPVFYRIIPRDVIIHAGSKSFRYDATPHSYDSWYVDDGTPLVGTDRVISATVTGTVTNVTFNPATGKDEPVANVIAPESVVLSRSAVRSNYNIICENGALSVGDGTLSAPIGLRWDSSAPGMARWSEVSADGDVEIKYYVTLYRVDGTTVTQLNGDNAPYQPDDGTFINLETQIKADYETIGRPCAYRFRVQAVVNGGADASNYRNSERSEASDLLNTMLFVIDDSVTGIASAVITGGTDKQRFMISGETVNVTAAAQPGYVLSNPVWTTSDGSHLTILTEDAASTDVTASPLTPGTYGVKAHTGDEGPLITAGSFTARNVTSGENAGKVSLSFSATDGLGITAWAITPTAAAPAAGSSEWNTLTEPLTSLTAERPVATEGSWYAHVTDGTNITTSSEPIRVYILSFARGDDSVTGSVASIARAEGLSVSMPSADGFAYPEHTFTGWLGGGRIYLANDTFNENVSREFTAQWATASVSARVSYFYQSIDTENGNTVSYPETPASEFTRIRDSGTAIGFYADSLDAPKTGFELDGIVLNGTVVAASDVTPENSSIVLSTESANTIAIYYRRSEYKLTFSCPGAEGLPGPITYRYGAKLATETCETVKPSKEGYDFYGWYFNGTSKPATMPAYDIEATGFFSTKSVDYKVVYYEEQLDGTFKLDTALSEEKSGFFNSSYSFTTAENDECVKPVTGFSPLSVEVAFYANGTSPAATESDSAGATSVNGSFTMQETMYVKYYYSRNAYDLTLRVVKSPRENNTVVFTYTTQVKYEAVPNFTPDADGYGTIPVTDFAGFESLGRFSTGDSETDLWRTRYCTGANAEALEGYILATFADWSTGLRPAAMPASDVTVVREYALDNEAPYTVIFKFADARNGSATPSYTNVGNLTFAATANTNVTIGVDSGDAVHDVNLAVVMKVLNNYQYYDFDNCRIETNQVSTDPETEETVYGYKVLREAPGVTPLVITVYAERKPYTATVRYYAVDRYGQTQIATKTISGKWGEKFEVEPLQYFYENRGDHTSTYNHDFVTITDSRSTEFDEAHETTGYAFNFLTNGYSVCYEVNGTITEVDTSEKLSSCRSLTTDISVNSGRSVKVYYRLYRESYVVDVNYRTNLSYLQNSDDAGGDVQKPLTITVGETEYKLRLANRCDIFASSYEAAPTGSPNYDPSYPGAAGNWQYTYTGGYANGFSELITQDGVTYYTSTADTSDYAYIAVDSNPFFYKSRAVVDYSAVSGADYAARFEKLEDFRSDYEAWHGKESHLGVQDENYDRITRANYGYSSLRELPKQEHTPSPFYSPASFYASYIYYGSSYKIFFNIFSAGYVCESHSHEYAQGKKVNPFKCSVAESYQPRPGYQLVWYTDTNFTNEWTSPLTMNQNHQIYGRYEKTKIANRGYVFYQLSDGSYLTDSDLKIGISGLEKKLVSTAAVTLTDTTVTLPNGKYKTFTTPAETWRYTYNGQLAAVSVDIPTVAFTEISLDYDSYAEDHYHFNSRTAGSWLKDYCQYTEIELKAYYEKDTVSLVTDSSYRSSYADRTVSTGIWGRSESLPQLDDSANAYLFDGWKFYTCTYDASSDTWTKSDEDVTSKVTCTPVTDAQGTITGYTVEMPVYDIWAEGQWKNAEFAQAVNHYFQDASQSYDTAKVAAMREALCSSRENLLTETGTFAVEGGGYARVTETGNSARVEYYDCSAAADVGELTLIGVTQWAMVTNNGSIPVSEFLQSSENFTFDYAVRNTGVYTTLSSTDSIGVRYPMSLDYYYAAKSYPVNDDQSVEAYVLASDNGAIGASAIAGAGSYSFKEQCILNLAVDKGYAVNGWYRAEDVLLTDGSFNTALTADELSALRLSDKHVYSFITAGPATLVAVIDPNKVDVPTVEIGKTEDPVYGYGSPLTLTAITALPADAAGETAIAADAYTWYEYVGTENPEEFTWQKINGVTGEDFVFPVGKNVGTYTYKCVVTAQNINNGRTAEAASEIHTVTVLPADAEILIDGTVDVYDATDNHGFTFVNPKSRIWNSDFEVYVSKTELTDLSGGTKLTAAEDLATAEYRFTDAGEHTLWYYILSRNPNIKAPSTVQTATVRILPKQVSVTASGYMAKTYDGTDNLTAENVEALNKSVRDGTLFVITGMCGGDDAEYKIGFETAIYDFSHCAEATAAVLTNITLSRTSDGVMNYTFGDGASLTVYGRIDPAVLPVVWTPGTSGWDDDGIRYTFDNLPHVPVASFSEENVVQGEQPSVLVEVNGGESTEAGSYRAEAALDAAPASETAGGYRASDYRLTNGTCPFFIEPCAVTISPAADADHPATVVYDGNSHTFASFSADPALPEGYSIVAAADSSWVHAGTHTVSTSPKGLMILDAAGLEATDNFTITLGSAELTVGKRTVAVKKIEAEDKVYDGNTAAGIVTGEVTLKSGSTVTCNPAEFENLLSGDEIVISGISGTFDTPDAGNDKPVTLDYSSAVLSGESAADYRIATVAEGSQETAAADITASRIAVSFAIADVTYGQSITVVPTYTDSEGRTVPASEISGTVVFTIDGTPVPYTIRTDDGVSETSYTFSFETAGRPDASASAYAVASDVTGLRRIVGTVDNDYDFASENASLKVNRRPLLIQAVSGEFSVTKVYDETTSATDANRADIKAGSYRLTAVGGKAESGIYGGDTVILADFSAAYNDADVPDAEKVLVTACTIGGASAGNYVLENDSYEIKGSITKKPVTVTPSANQSKIYGNADPALLWTAKSGSETVANSKLNILIWRDKNEDKHGGEDVYDAYVIHTSGDTDNDPSTDNNPNYLVTCETGVFAVKDRPLYISVDGVRSLVYGDGYFSASAFGAYTVSVDGWADGDEAKFGAELAAAVTGFRWSASTVTNAFGEKEVTSGTALNAGDILNAGTFYAGVAVDESLLTAVKNNYRLVYSPKTITVEKKTVTVTGGITASDRTYDGTVAAALDVSAAVISGIIEKDAGTVTLSLAPNKVTGKFPDKNAGAGKTVAITYAAGALSIGGAGSLLNYQLASSGNQSSATASISKKDLHVTADDKTVVYGTAVSALPNFTVTYTKADFVSGDTAANSVTGTAAFLSTGYTPTSPVSETDGVFAITVDETDAAATRLASVNYDLLYTPGKLTVTPAVFAAPAAAWDSTVPGKVTWNAVAPISAVGVESYLLTLYKDGTAVTDVSVPAGKTPSASYEYSFADYIHEIGRAGRYEVTAQTISARPADAASSAEGAKSGSLYAAKVTAVYKDDAVTAEGKGTGAISALRIGAGTASADGSAILIAGESMSVTADMKNDTGYVPSCAERSSAKLTLGEISVKDADFNAATNLTFTAELKKNLTSSENVTVEISFLRTPATLDLSMQAYYQNAKVNALIFNYLPADVKIVTTPSTVEDNVGTDAYAYSAEWTIQDNYPRAATPVTGVTDLVWDNEDSFKYPGGLRVPSSSRPLYPVFCTVTATRLDNGETVTLQKELVVPVEPAGVYPTVPSSSWTYGEARDWRDVTSNPGNAGVEYFYSASPYTGELPLSFNDAWLAARKSENGWVAGRPTDAGTWYIYAYVRASSDFKAGWSSSSDADGNVPTVITINKAKLATPDNLKLTQKENGHTYYGRTTWDRVTTFTPGYVPSEGAPEITNSNTSNLKENLGTAGASASEVGVTYDIVLSKDGAVLNTWSGVVSTANLLNITPYLTTQGKYTFEVTAISDSANCLPSDPVSGSLVISKKVVETTHGKSSGNPVSRVYDGTPTVLSIDGAGEGYKYEWYNGTELVGTEATLPVYDVAQSGIYTCVINDGKLIFSTSIEIEITPRPITLTPDSAQKTYDGTALTYPGFTVTTGTDAGLDEETLAYAFEAGSTTKKGTAGSSIHSITLSMTDDSAQTDATRDYRDPENGANKAEGSVSAEGFGIRYNIIDEESIVIMRGSGEKAVDATADYTVTTVVSDAGTLKVLPKNAEDHAVGEITIASVPDAVYTGLPQEPTPVVTYVIEGRDPITLVSGTDFTYSYTTDHTNVGTVTVTATGKGNYAGSVSTPFAITKAPLTISANDSSVVYGTAAANEGVTYTGLVNSESAEKVLGDTSAWTYAYTSEVTPNWTQDVTYSGTPAIPAEAAGYDRASSPVGNYVISLTGWTSDNYSITFETGRMTVTNAEITVNAKGQKSGENGRLVYDGTAQNALTLGKIADSATAVNSLPVTWQYRTDEAAAWSDTFPSFTDAGTYTVYYKVSADNHNDVTGSYTVTVDRAALHIASIGNTWTYDGLNHTNNVYTVSLNGTDVTDTAGGSATKEYSINSGDTVTITPAPLNGGVTDYNKDYKNNNVFTVDVTRGGTSVAEKNYTVTTAFGTLFINKREITVTADSAAKIYDGTPLTCAGFTVTGGLDETETTYDKSAGTAASGRHSVTVTMTAGSTVTQSGTQANTVNTVVILRGDTPATDNYIINKKTGTLEVTKRRITVTSDAFTTVFNGKDQKNENTVSSLTASVTEGETYTGNALASGDGLSSVVFTAPRRNAGTYSGENAFESLVIVNASGTDVTSSYEVAHVNGDIIINPKDLSTGADASEAEFGIIGISAADVTYNGETRKVEPTVTHTYPGAASETTLVKDSDYTITGWISSLGDEDIRKAATITATVEGQGNYTGTRTVSYSILKREITITSYDLSKTYDGTPLTEEDSSDVGRLQITSGSLGTGDSIAAVEFTGSKTDAGTCTGNDGNTFKNVVIVHGTGEPAEDATDNYTITPVYGKLTVSKAALAVSSATKSWTYDGLAHAMQSYAVTYAGASETITPAEGEKVAALTLASGDTVTITPTEAGANGVTDCNAGYSKNNTYAVTITSGSDDKSGNYTVTTAFGTLSIDKAEITGISASQNGGLTYDGTEQTATVSTAATTVNSQPATFLYSASPYGPFTETVPAFKDAGEHTVYYKVTAPNHNDSAVGSFSVTIDKRPVTITAAASLKKYGAADPAFAVATMANNVSGELGGISLTVLRTDREADGGETKGTHKNVLTIAASKAALEAKYTNYTFTIVPADFEITSTDAAVTVTSATQSWTYDGELHKEEVYTVTLGGAEIKADGGSNGKMFTLYNGDKLTVTPTAEGVKDYSASYSKNNTFTYTLGNSENYTSQTATAGTLSIDKRPVTITATGAQKKYGASDPAFAAATMENNVSGELGGISLTVLRTDKEAAGGETKGIHENVLTIADSKETLEAAYANYTFTIVPADFEITATEAAVTVTSATKSWTYDGQLHKEEVYTVTLDGAEITADGGSDGKMFTLYNGDKLTVTPTAEGVKDYSASYSKNNTFTYTLDHIENYTNRTATAGTLSIDKRAVTITATGAQKKYGASDPAFAAATMENNVSGELGGISLTVLRTDKGTAGGEAKGTHEGVLTIASSKAALEAKYANYTFTIVPADFEITSTDAAVTITSATQSWTYDGQLHKEEVYTVTLDGTVITADDGSDGKVFTLYNGDKLTVTPTAAGVKDYSADYSMNNTFTYTLGNSENYTSQTATAGTLSIGKAEITGISASQNGGLTYDGTEQTATVSTAATTVNSQPATFLYSASPDGPFTETVPAFKDAGEHTVYYKVTAPNHNDSSVGSFSVTIDKRPVTITATGAQKKYGAEDPAFAAATMENNVSCELGEISLTVLRTDREADGGETKGTHKNVLTIAASKASLEATYANYTFTIVPADFEITATEAAVTITSATQSWTYDGQLHKEEVYAVTLDGAEIKADDGSNGKVFTLYNGDKLTVTPTAEGVKDYSADYSENNTFTYTLDHSENYTSQTATAGTLSISKRPVTITATGAQKKYGASDPAFAAATMENNVSGELGEISLTVHRTDKGTAGGEAKGTHAGVLTIASSKADLEAAYTNYTFTIVPASFEITATDAAVTVTSATQSWTYDGQLHKEEVYAVTLDGTEITADDGSDGKVFTLYNGDKLTVTPTAEGVKDYSADYSENNTFTYTLDNIENYTNRTATAGTLSIGKAEITGISASQNGGLTYDGTEQAATVSTAATTVNGQTATFLYSTSPDGPFTETVPAFKDAGEHTVYYEVTAPNHNDSTVGSFSVTIDKRPVTITAAGAQKKYGAADPSFKNAVMANNVSGELGGIGLKVLRTDKKAAGGETEGTHAGVLTIASSKASLEAKYANYAFTIVPADFEITSTDAAVTVTSATKSWTYDGQLHKEEVYTVTLDGTEIKADDGSDGKVFTLYNGDKLTVIPKTAGVKDYSASYSRNNAFTYTLEHGKYYANQTATAGTLSIDRRPVTITGNDGQVFYNGKEQSVTEVTVSGLLDGHSHNAVYQAKGTDAGNYTGIITKAEEVVIESGEGKVTSNYEITTKPGTLTIDPVTVTVTWSGNREYKFDGKTHGVNVTVTTDTGNGKINGMIPGSGATCAITGKTAVKGGSYTARVTFNGTKNNYILPTNLTCAWKISENPAILIEENPDGDINSSKVVEKDTDTLTAELSKETNIENPVYKWYRKYADGDWELIENSETNGGYTSEYKLTEDDVGAWIRCEMTDPLVEGTVIADKVAYVPLYFTRGMGQTYSSKLELPEDAQLVTAGTGEDAPFETNGKYARFLYPMVDGVRMSDDDYYTAEGCTEIILRSRYLDTLSEEKHILTAVYEGGASCDTDFYVKFISKSIGNAGEPDEGNRMDDHYDVAFPFISMVAAALTQIWYYRKRKKYLEEIEELRTGHEKQ